jgi:hypothetical protein
MENVEWMGTLGLVMIGMVIGVALFMLIIFLVGRKPLELEEPKFDRDGKQPWE